MSTLWMHVEPRHNRLADDGETVDLESWDEADAAERRQSQ